MKKSIIFTIVIFLSLQLIGQTKEEVLAVHKQYDEAVTKKDAAFAQRLFHDDMVITGGNGLRRNKAEEIKDLTDPMYDVTYFTTKNIEVSMFGDVAILRGDLEWEMKMGGNANVLKRRITFTYQKTKDGWKIIAQHVGLPPR